MEIFKRSKLNPILKPIKKNTWESEKLYNPGVIFNDDKYHMFYRAVGSSKNWHSSIGYAVSCDGENFVRQDQPILSPKKDFEKRGLEDPRLTKIGENFYMVYAAYDGDTPRLCMAKSQNLLDWGGQAPILEGFKFQEYGGQKYSLTEKGPVKKIEVREWSKSGALFPEKIGGKYYLLFGEYNIWLAESDDLKKWQVSKQPFLSARQGKGFDSLFVEMGPPPIKTELGWLVLYHGINHAYQYQLSWLFLDLLNPKKIIKRSSRAIFWPQEPYELSGQVDVLPLGQKNYQKLSKDEKQKYLEKAERENFMPQVVFCNGAVVVEGKLKIYYGAGDDVICQAEAELSDLMGLVNIEQNG